MFRRIKLDLHTLNNGGLVPRKDYHSDMLSESSIMMTSLDSRVTTLQQSLTAKVKKPRKSKSTN
jgi:hypothetical protein